MRSRHVAAALLLPAVLLVGACGTAPAETTSPASTATAAEVVDVAEQAGGELDEADVRFLQAMVAHHEQGLEMVRLAAENGQEGDVRELAAALEAIQSDELELMRSWLDTWDEPIPDVGHSVADHAHHGGLPAIGEEELAALSHSGDEAYDETFLNLFIAHQHNAVELARMHENEGASAEVEAFADRLVESRSAEVAHMLTMLGS